jgi:hypothetical protein
LCWLSELEGELLDAQTTSKMLQVDLKGEVLFIDWLRTTINDLSAS